jgi:hypothetical protein
MRLASSPKLQRPKLSPMSTLTSIALSAFIASHSRLSR